MDPRDLFIGLSLLLDGSREQRLECAFSFLNRDNSGRVSGSDVELFLGSIAPHTLSRQEVSNLARQVMQEVDASQSHRINYQEFCSWRGMHVALEWVDTLYCRVAQRLAEGPSKTAKRKQPAAQKVNAPVESMSIEDREGTPGLVGRGDRDINTTRSQQCFRKLLVILVSAVLTCYFFELAEERQAEWFSHFCNKEGNAGYIAGYCVANASAQGLAIGAALFSGLVGVCVCTLCCPCTREACQDCPILYGPVGMEELPV